MQELPATLKSIFLGEQWGSIWLPLVITGLSCPLLIHLAPVITLFDRPGDSGRKIHEEAKPLGGAAILLGFLPTLITYGSDWVPLFFAIMVVFFTGLMDDIRGLNPKSKLALQIVAAAVVTVFHPFPPTDFSFAAGFNITVSGLPGSILIGFWLVGGTNAFNLIDGLDGLAAGLGIIALSPILVLTFGNAGTILVGALVSALIGILIYNFYPAKLFLGDGGSYLVGFLVSYLVIEGLYVLSASGRGWSIFAGVLFLGVPVIDTILAILRRVGSERGIMEADQNHLHHRLYRRFGHLNAVILTYLLQSALSGLAALIVL